MKQSVCKGCGNPIVWATNPATGKKVPLDPKGVIYRAVELPNGEVEAIREDDDSVMISHFQTCPEANKFNRSSK